MKERGADLSIQNKAGATPLQLADSDMRDLLEGACVCVRLCRCVFVCVCVCCVFVCVRMCAYADLSIQNKAGGTLLQRHALFA